MKPNRYFLAIACGCAAGAVACADVVGISGYENGDALDASTGDGALESAPDTSPDGEVLGDVSDGATAEDAAEGGTPDTASSDTGGVDTGKPDAGPDADTGTADTGVTDTGVMDSGPVDSGGVSPYRHTITIDGTNDFSPTSEKLATTTTSVDAYVTWDASALYVGYVGSDLGALASANKWLFVYLDADPTAGTGATKTDVYATQQSALPAGFGADAYFACKSDGSFQLFKKYASTAWSTVASPGVTFNRNAAADYLEMRIPFTALGSAPPAKLGVVTFLLDEASGAESTYAGLWGVSFTDGYSGVSAPKSIGSYLLGDLGAAGAPNSVVNRRP